MSILVIWRLDAIVGLFLLFSSCGFALASREGLLYNKLFKTYNKKIRPVNHRNSTIQVIVNAFGPGFHIEDVNLLRGTLYGNLWVDLRWKDAFLTWNSSDYDEVEILSVDSKDIWLPDIATGSDEGPMKFITPDHLGNAIVHADGTVIVAPVVNIGITFQVSVTKYPFDEHPGLLQFCSWTYSNNLVSVGLSKLQNENSFFSANGQWDIRNFKAENFSYSNGQNLYDCPRYRFTLKRKWLYYVINIMGPLVLMSALNGLCFLLPSESGERLSLSVTVFLSLTVFLNVVNSALPESSDRLSILAVYIGLQLLGSALTITMTVISLKLYYQSGDCKCTITPFRLLERLGFKRNTNNVEKSEDKGLDKNESELQRDDRYGSWKSLSDSLNVMCIYMSVLWNIGLILMFIIVVNV